MYNIHNPVVFVSFSLTMMEVDWFSFMKRTYPACIYSKVVGNKKRSPLINTIEIFWSFNDITPP